MRRLAERAYFERRCLMSDEGSGRTKQIDVGVGDVRSKPVVALSVASCDIAYGLNQ